MRPKYHKLSSPTAEIFLQYKSISSVHDLSNGLLANLAILLAVSADAEVGFAELLTLHFSKESLVVSNDNELEVGLGLAVSDDCVEGPSQGLDVVAVKIRSRLIKSDDLEQLLVMFDATPGRKPTPQLTPKHSARARRIMMLAKTFCPALQRPRISISAPDLTITTR